MFEKETSTFALCALYAIKTGAGHAARTIKITVRDATNYTRVYITRERARDGQFELPLAVSIAVRRVRPSDYSVDLPKAFSERAPRSINEQVAGQVR